jgi:hypothetical protein
MVMAATTPAKLIAPKMVSTFPCFCGVLSDIRSPRGDGPRGG